MADLLLPGLMPEEWRALIAGCWAPNPDDRPSVTQLRHHICTLQQKAQTARTHMRQSFPTALSSCTTPSRQPAASDASQLLGLPKVVTEIAKLPRQSSNAYMPVPSASSISSSRQSCGSMQASHKVLGHAQAVEGDAIAAVPSVRLPVRRDDSAQESASWSWKSGFRGMSAGFAAAVSKGVIDVTAQSAEVVQLWADSQLSAKAPGRVPTGPTAL